MSTILLALIVLLVLITLLSLPIVAILLEQKRSFIPPSMSLSTVRIAVVGFALLLTTCTNPPSSQRLSATAAVSSTKPPTLGVALATTTPPALPPAPTSVRAEAPHITLPLPADLPTAVVVRVIDGDTVDVHLDGQVVRLRLIGIDTPEVVDPRRPVECFGREASAKAHALLDGQTVAVEADPSQGDADRYGRLLRYIWLPNGHLFNLEMVAQGYAFEYTYDVPYAYQATFRQAERDAREAQRGLWSPQACAGEHRPAEEAVPTSAPEPQSEPSPLPPATQLPAAPARGTNCDAAYPDVCIPPPPPDLDCGDVPYRRFRVLPPDPHRLDGDNDGIGCER
jgi:micrococcal nuclease